MDIGILGAGNVGGTLGARWAQRGHRIVFGVRNPNSEDIKQTLAGCDGKARAASPADAASAEVVVNCLPWPATKGVIENLNLKGKALLDCSNPLKPDLSGLEIGTTTSAGEMVASWATGARVVKIFNTTGYNNMANPAYNGEPIPMFYCGDDAEANRIAAQLASDVGFDPVHAGPLSNARLLEPYAMLWIWLAFHGMGRDFAFRIARR